MTATANGRAVRNGRWGGPGVAAALAASLTTTFLLTAPAHAYTVFWPNQTFEYVEPAPPQPKRIRKPKPHYPGLAAAPKDLAKPNGPLIIVVSIDKQTLRVFDANGLLAETPVSTGMSGHSTPMGVFSIIQKSKWHRSNIYSGAPMPYMQRITWSGVALHAGVLPGYPASHGCIRMPTAFATKLWSWSRLGARVIVAPGELTPTDISHPALLAHAEQIAAKAEPATASSVEAAATFPGSAAANEGASLPSLDRAELRLTPHDSTATTAAGGAVRIRVADAEGGIRAPVAADTATKYQDQDTNPSAGQAGGVKADGKTETKIDTTPDAGIGAKSEAGLETKPETMSADVKTEPKSAPEAKDQDRTAGPAAAASPNKGSPDAAAPTRAEAPPAPKRTGHVAVLISRKDNRLYVRQNFEPWFDVPMTFAAGDRPLGTHVFTARPDGAEAGSYRWSVVSLPAGARRRIEVTDRRGRHLVQDVTAPTAPQTTPAEALDRLAIPEEARIRIASALATGTSIIVSDLGPGSETGLGTDFIMQLR